MKKIKVIFIVNFLLLSMSAYYYITTFVFDNKIDEKGVIKTEIDNIIIKDKITISAVGDCTLGSDPNFGYERSFHYIADVNNHDYSYFFKGVRSVLGTDDLTIANLETTFTDATKRAPKKFNFKGPAKYAEILPKGSVEVVNIANNHIYDYLEVGYNDTIKALEDVNMPYFGEDKYHIYTVKGMRIGLIGYYEIENPNIYQDLDKGLKYLKDNNVDLILVTFHWGIERTYRPLQSQRDLAYYAIDNGADLIIGHHPHVIQGIEKYKDKYIIYSLANFSFGGNKNPDDKDTFIFQQTFELENKNVVGTSINIIPVSVSSRKDVNDYQPQILEGTEKDRVLKKILDVSYNLDYN